MFRRSIRSVLLSSAAILTVLTVGVIWGESSGVAAERENSEAEALTSELRRQEEELERTMGGLTQVGIELKESQGQVDEARVRQEELGRRARKLNASLEAQKTASARSRSRLEDRIQVAYKSGEIEGLLLLLDGLFGDNDARGSTSAILQASRLITESSRSIQNYQDTKQSLRSTLRQVEEREAEHREFRRESQALVENLEGHKSELRASVEELGLQRGQMEERLAQLEAEEEAGLLERPPATGRVQKGKTRDRDDVQVDRVNRDDVRNDVRDSEQSRDDDVQGERQDREEVRDGKQNQDDTRDDRPNRDDERDWQKEDREQVRERELKIAREDIASQPVEPIPYEEYVRLYKESAERYGFGEDWYVLAAVGKIESNHGENVGSSSAGAMGPMQFLPSTWISYGVDGDGDGEANIMDPKDAIPAAASYLKAGGAPDDWYAALFTYNRAGWYVEEVLVIAENYRRIHRDHTVGPYLESVTTPTMETSPSPEPVLQLEDVPDGEGEGPREEHPSKDTPPPPDKAPPPDKSSRPTDDDIDAKEGTVLEAESPAATDEAAVGQYQY